MGPESRGKQHIGHEGKYGITSVTALQRELRWPTLLEVIAADTSVLYFFCTTWLPYHQTRLAFREPPDQPAIWKTRTIYNIPGPATAYSSSPLWNSTVFRTIPEWDNLPATVVEADSLSLFKSQLTAPQPQGLSLNQQNICVLPHMRLCIYKV